MSDVKHDPWCWSVCKLVGGSGHPHPIPDGHCTCGAERIAELKERVRDLEAKLTHLRNLITNHEGKATSLVEEIRRGLEE